MKKNTTTMKWRKVNESDVPLGLRWDTPQQNQGQIVEVSYGGPVQQLSEHCELDARWKRVFDHSDRQVNYYVREESE